MDLDTIHLYVKYDRQGMLAQLHEVPQLCQQAWQLAMKFNLPPDYYEIDKIVILGMGGSAIGGSLVNSLLLPEAMLPILVHRDYDLPAFTDARTLVIASSYSGMTEETIASFRAALETDAKKLLITTGGRLKTMAEDMNIPVFSFDYKSQPRAALPFSFLPIICFLQRLGIIKAKSTDITKTVQVLRKLSQQINEDIKQSCNPAKQLAQHLHKRLPVIYGAGIVSEVAHRWKTQFNENSKTWAFYEIFPELNHNAIVGYQFPKELISKILVVLLHSSYLSKRIQHRYTITRQLLGRAKVNYQIIDGVGENPLSQMLSLILFGDYTSFYLAMLYRTDPSPVKAIDYLKKQLAKHK